LVRKVLGWEPKVSLEEGLEKTYRWISMMVERDKELGKEGGLVEK
jgi:nucleoside-diphosphate-sugar epimerase